MSTKDIIEVLALPYRVVSTALYNFAVSEHHLISSSSRFLKSSNSLPISISGLLPWLLEHPGELLLRQVKTKG